MFDAVLFKTLLSNVESPILEFKSCWYWNENECNDMAKAWGEFLKDFASLVNANSDYYGQVRYLIIGVNDNGEISGCNLPDLIKENFKNQIINKLEKNFNYTPEFNINRYECEGKNIFIFEISQPNQILRVITEFHDKKHICRKNSIFVRGIQGKLDQIDIAEEDQIYKLQKCLGIELGDGLENIEFKIECRNIDIALEYFAELKGVAVKKGFPLIFEKNNPRYKASVYSFKNEDEFGHEFNFLYINSFSNFKQLIIEMAKYNNIINKEFVVVTDRPASDGFKRLQYIEKIFKEAGFKVNKTMFLDDFGESYLYKNNLNEIKFTSFKKKISYVQSDAIVKGSNRDKDSHTILNEWMKRIYEPILVIQGEGGIGKTTLLEQYLNKLNDMNKKTKIIYMTSSNILNKIADEDLDINMELFDFYQLAIDSPKKFTRDLLKLSLDEGKVFVVLDGIDEVISKLSGKFNFKYFIQKIIDEYSFNNGSCKIVFTCRNQFWDDLNLSDRKEVSVVTLQPFTNQKAKEYFNKAFNDLNMEKQALKILRKFNQDSQKFIPFMLDTVKYLVEKKASIEEFENIDTIDSLVEEMYLPTNYSLLHSNTNDYLIFKLCGHEYKKYELYDVNQQISLFIRLASEFDGEIQVSQLSQLDSKIENKKVITLGEHLLLEATSCSMGEKLVFKYDFLNKYFKQLGVAKFIADLDESKIDDYLLRCLSDVGYANQFSNEILQRVESAITNKEDEFLTFSLSMFEKIEEKYFGEMKINHSSNVLVLFIYLYKQVFSRTPDEFVGNIFQSKDCIDKLNLKNISPMYNSSKKITFSFENKLITNSHIENFDNFWDCKFSKSTVFDNCTLVNIKNRPTQKNEISPIIFDKSRIDTNLRESIDYFFESLDSKNSRVKKQIEKILKIFVSNGNFHPQKVGKVSADVSKFNGNITLDKLIKLGVIQKHNESVMLDNEFIISDEFLDLIDVVVQDNSSIIMDRLVKRCQV